MRIYLFIITALFCSFAPHAAAQNCSNVPEGIVKLRAPEIGAFNMWDALYGERDLEESFRSGLVKENGHVIAAGERYKIGDKTITLIVAEFDRRGRMVWEKEHDIPELQGVVKTFAHDDGFVVLANKNDGPRIDAAWIGVFDLRGEIKSQRLLRLPNLRIAARDLVKNPAGSGFIMVASAKQKVANAEFYSVFIRLNSKFQFVSKRAFQPGLENEILGLAPFGDDMGAFIATGYIRNARGRKNGWMMRLENDGAIGWQRQFPRGIGASVLRAVPYQNDRIFAIGEALPSSADDFKGGWVMMLNQRNGDIIWQRYYTGSRYAYTARDMMVSEDGLISVLLDGDPPAFGLEDVPAEDEMAEDDEERMIGDPMGRKEDYVRLLTLNPRGVIFSSMHFFNGQGSDAFEILRGPVRERIIIGHSDVRYEIENPETPDNPSILDSREGWLLAAPAMDSYSDPCVP